MACDCAVGELRILRLFRNSSLTTLLDEKNPDSSVFLQHLNNINNFINRLTPNDPYMGRTATLTSKRCILYIYSTNIGTEYFKLALYSPFFSLQNAVCLQHKAVYLLSCRFTLHVSGVNHTHHQ